jgi:hypothetical protein
MVLGLVVAAAISGGITNRIHYYNPAMLFGTAVMAVGGGLLSTLSTDSGSDKWIGYQFVFGFGLGSCMQGANLAVQAVLPADDVAAGVALMFFLQQLGGAVGTSAGQVVYANTLVAGIKGVGLPDLGAAGEVVHAGAVDLILYIEAKYPEALAAVLAAYNYAVTRTFLCVMAFSLASLVSVFFMEWINLKDAEERNKREKMAKREAQKSEKTAGGEGAPES